MNRPQLQILLVRGQQQIGLVELELEHGQPLFQSRPQWRCSHSV
jgi:hypothetical protein